MKTVFVSLFWPLLMHKIRDAIISHLQAVKTQADLYCKDYNFNFLCRWQQDKEKELEAAPPISSDLAIIKQQLEQIKVQTISRSTCQHVPSFVLRLGTLMIHIPSDDLTLLPSVPACHSRRL